MAHFIQTGPYSLHCFILLLEFNRVLDKGIIIIFAATATYPYQVVKTTGKQTSYLFFGVRLCRHLSSDSRGTKPLFWRARDALGQDTLKGLIIKDGNFLCLSSPSAILTQSHYGFFCTTWVASCKGLIKFMNAFKTSRLVFPSDGVWGSCRTLITLSKTKLELVNRVIGAEELEIRTLPFSSDFTYDTIAYSLMETR